MKDFGEGPVRQFFVASNAYLLNRDFYIHRVWSPARLMREKIGGRTMWVTALELIYDFDGQLFFGSGKPYSCPNIDQIFGYGDNRWIDNFLQADQTGLAPRVYARQFERLRLIELYCRLSHVIDWSSPAPLDGSLHLDLPGGTRQGE